MPRRLVPAALLALLLPLPLLPTANAGPPDQQSAAPVQVAPAATGQISAGAKTFTLVTGDVVRVSGTGADRRVEVVSDAVPIGDILVSTLNNDLYAVPTAVSPLLATGRLDQQLFNLSELDRSGYDDASTPKLPLIATYQSSPAGTAARRSLTAKVPAGASSARELPAARATALTMDRSKRAAFLNGFGALAGSSYRGLAAGVGKLWLDAKVKVSSDEANILIGAGTAWQRGYDGTGQTIAVLDTGLDDTHPDLAGKVVASKSFVPTDPDALADEYGHGTHVASIAAGSGTASQGKYAGAAKGAKLVIGKVLADNGYGQTSWIIEGMAWAAEQAKTVNMSLGGGPTDGTDPLAAALDEISGRTGSLFVTAAGNLGPGYGNPQPFTVATPASAGRALAVGNGHHSFYLSPSSSAGPGIGSLGLKPEIVAPGTEIVAARSADANLYPIPEAPQYTYMSGTSMASPRVAGAVAVLRQQHPDWTAAQLRDAITSTSCTTGCRGLVPGTTNAANPQIYWRGAGGLDLHRATEQTVRGTGLLEFGVHSDPLPANPVASKAITYVNEGDQPVTLQLKSSVQRPDANFTYNVQPYEAPPGLLDIPAAVTVPAGGTAAVPVKVDLAKAPAGSVYGELVATTDQVQVRTTFSWTRTAELHRLTIDYTGPNGQQGSADQPVYGALTDLDTGTQRGVAFFEGRGYLQDFAGGVTDRPLLPAHRYSLFTFQSERAVGAYSNFIGSWTAGGVPDIKLTSDRAIRLDARARKPWKVSTERPSLNAGPRVVELSRQFPLNGGQSRTTYSTSLQSADFSLYAIPGAAPETGSVEMRVLEHREAPPITLRVAGQTIHPRRPLLNSPAGGFPAVAVNRLYDGADGTPEQLAGARGRLVLVDEIVKVRDRIVIDDVVAAATQAGATGVLVAVRDAGIAERLLRKASSVPVGVVTQAEGKAIRAAIASGRTLVPTVGAFPSPYTYDLVHKKSGGIGTDLTAVVRDRDLGKRRTTYYDQGTPGYRATGHIRGDFFGLAWSYTGYVPVGLTRDDLATPGYTFGRDWNLLDQYTAFWSSVQAVGRGHTVVNDVGSGTTAPALSGFTRTVNDKLFLDLAGAPYSGSRSAIDTSFYAPGVSSDFKVNGTTCQAATASTCVLPSAGRYQLEYTASQGVLPLAQTSGAKWTVNVTKAPDTTPVPQPIIAWNWSTSVGTDNTAPRRPYSVTVKPGYATARPTTGPVEYLHRHGTFTVKLEATYDDGATWVTVGTRKTSAGKAADFTVRPQANSNGFVGYRISGSDQAGNALEQWVLRAARTS